MPQSFSGVYVHYVFSTKGRVPFLKDPDFRERTFAYLGGISNHLGCDVLKVGGVEDHIHLLARQSRTITIAGTVMELKTRSSVWVKEVEPSLSRFAWQSGYGAFSVGAEALELVRAYIRSQEDHHRKVSFQEEFKRILTENGLEWDEKYVWD